jgi:hypothetical protein
LIPEREALIFRLQKAIGTAQDSEKKLGRLGE